MSTIEIPAGAAGVIERRYLAVPTNYSIGQVFEFDPADHDDYLRALTEAVAHARSTITRFDYPSQTPDHKFSRAWVDHREMVRWVGGGKVDRVVERVEVFLDAASLPQVVQQFQPVPWTAKPQVRA